MDLLQCRISDDSRETPLLYFQCFWNQASVRSCRSRRFFGFMIKNVKTRALFVVGERDAECPAPQSHELWHAPRTLGVPVERSLLIGLNSAADDRAVARASNGLSSSAHPLIAALNRQHNGAPDIFEVEWTDDTS